MRTTLAQSWLKPAASRETIISSFSGARHFRPMPHSLIPPAASLHLGGLAFITD